MRANKSSKVRWAWHIYSWGKKMHTKFQSQILQRHKSRREENIKIDLKIVGYEDTAQIGAGGRFLWTWQ
jgi:hypothetical protein